MKEFWDERYSAPHYVYGEEPNAFFKEQLDGIKQGKILLPAEGEGRNAVYAASRGWQVYAFDQSIEGKKKALQLSQKKDVQIEYQVGSLTEMTYPAENFDAIALIYAHFPSANRKNYHHRLLKYLKKGGYFILEAFSKNHKQFQLINEQAGGPKDEDLLYSIDYIMEDFPELDSLVLLECETELREGFYHQGKSSVIRFTGRKMS